MPGLFDDIPVAAKPPPKSAGLFDDIPVAAKTAPKTAAPPAAAQASPYENEKTPLDTLKRVVKGVLNIPKAAFEASEERRLGGDYDPAPIVDAATLAVGPSVAGVRLGLKATPKTGEAPKPPPEAPKPPEAAPAAVKLNRVSPDKYNILDSEGKVLAHAEIGIVHIDGKKLAQVDDIYTPDLEGVKTQEAHDAVVKGARHSLGTSQMRDAMRQFLAMHPDVEGFTGNRTSGARNAGRMGPENIQNITVPVPKAPKAAVEGEQAFMDRAFKSDEAPKAPTPAPVGRVRGEINRFFNDEIGSEELSQQAADLLKKMPSDVRQAGFDVVSSSGKVDRFLTEGDILDEATVRELKSNRAKSSQENAQKFEAWLKQNIAPEAPAGGGAAPPKGPAPPSGGPPPGKGMFDDIPAAKQPPIKEQVVNLSDDLQKIKQSGVADRAEIGNRIEQAPKEILDKDLQEKFYHAIEDPKKMAELTPQERALFDQHVQPLRAEATQLYNTIKKLGGEKMVDDPTYVHRIVKGHAPQYDTLSGEAANPIAGTRSLKKTTSALQERKFYAIENAKGERFVVSRDDGGGVSVWKDGKPTKIKKEGDLQPGRGMEIGGQDWEIKQARTVEIEANSDVRYHKNAMLNTADAVVRMREVARNLEFLEKTKASPWWLENATRAGGNKKIPAGWRQPKMPQLHDWFVNPKLANVLDDFYKPGLLDADSALRKVNQFATGSIFWNPLPHIENVAAHWFTGRGWDWVKPGPIRHFATDSGRAIQAVVTQNKLYQDFLREGGGLVYGGVKNADFYQAMGKKFGMEIEKNWGEWHAIAKKLGMNKPGEFTAWWYGKVRNVLWAANDMFMMHRYLELERKGVPRAKAIKEAEKHIPNYRIPPEVLGSRTFSQILQEPGLTIFSRYHYGMWKSYMNLITDMAKGSPKEKIDALGNMAALGFLMYGVYPAIDYALQKLTGDPKAQKLRRGSASIPEWTKELYQGDMTFPQFLSNTVTLAPVTKEAVSLSNFWDRRPDVQRVDDLAKTAVSPYSTARQFMDERTGGNTAGRSALNIAVGAKNTSERTERGKKMAKAMRDKQTRKYIQRLKKDVGGAVDKVKSVFGGPSE